MEDVPATAIHQQPPAIPVPSSFKGGLGGLFGGKKTALADENAHLRASLQAVGAMSAVELASEIERLRTEAHVVEQDLTRVRADLARVRDDLATARQEVVQTNETAQLQEAGIYEYAHPLSDAVGYKDLLARVKSDVRDMIKQGRAVDGSTTWQVNGSAAKGRKMVSDFSKLLLRAYNAEADNCVRTVKPHSRRASLERLSKASDTISRLGRTMDIHITHEYHQVRLYEIELTADYLAKVEAEREALRQERERLRDEAAAAREIEREKAKLAKEQSHYENALARMIEKGLSPEEIASAEQKLAEIRSEMEKLISREANIRAGWVYVISNIGAFGDRMVKIGLTRRLEPLDRVRELGDASVPFRYDVHALVQR